MNIPFFFTPHTCLTRFFFFFSSRRRHTRWNCDWSSDVCSSDLEYGRLLAQPFNPASGRLSDEPALLTDSVFNPGGQIGYTVSASGILLFQHSPRTQPRLWLARTGAVLDSMGRDSAWTHRVSHNGRFVAEGGYVLSVRDLRRGVVLQLAIPGEEADITAYPVWSPDDAHIAFVGGGRSPSLAVVR